MKSKLTAGALVAMLVVAIALFAHRVASETRGEATPATAVVARADVERSIVAAGVIQPLEFVEIGAQISGQLRSLKVRLGDKVRRGQLLAEIDPTLNTAKLVEAEATVDNLRAQRRAKEDQLTLAQLQRKRGEALFKQDALARAEVEVLESNYRVAASGLASLDAQIRQSIAQLATARANLGYTKIVAPMDGEVVAIIAREGQTLNANQQAPMLMRIARLDRMTVSAQVPEAEVPRLRVGHPVHFTVLGEPDRRRDGKIRQILPAPEIVNGVVFYNALFDVPNEDRVLKVQMTAQVFFVVDAAPGVLTVPIAALTPDAKGRPNRHRVGVLRDDRTIEERTIETGIKDGVIAQVVRGLAEGEAVVVEATERKSPKRSSALAKAKPR